MEINLAEEYEAEYRIHLAMQHFKFKQNEWQKNIYKCLDRQDKAILYLANELDAMHHSTD